MSKQILIIDDEETILKAFALALSDSKHEIITTSSADAALRFFEEKNIDLVFLDLNMPVLNGVEVLKKIRQKSHSVPVCIVTAYMEGYQNDIDALDDEILKNVQFLRKPIGIHKIEQVVSEHLE